MLKLIPFPIIGRRVTMLAFAFIAIVPSTVAAQTARTTPRPNTAQSRAAKPKAPQPADNPASAIFNDPELLAQIGTLYEQMEKSVHFPPPRSASRLMPLLPYSTVFYAAMPNYGDAAQEALTVFHDELQKNDALRKWWTTGDMAQNGPKIEDAISKYRQVSTYLGDEIVISGAMEKSTPQFIMLAQITKPGLKPVLQHIMKEVADRTIANVAGSAKMKAQSDVHIVDVQELAALADNDKNAVILVRPDYLVAGPDVATVRAFSSRLDAAGNQFPSTAFGARVLKAYQDGITVVGAIDLHTILNEALGNKKEDIATAQRSGFSDVEYLVWEHTRANGRDVSQTELSFTGPRHGIAAWLAPPSTLGSLDFASPNAVMAMALNLASPSQMFDDVRSLATATNPGAFANVSEMERSFGIDFQRDFLQALTGEIQVEVDTITPPAWKVTLGVKNPARIQQTLGTLLAAQKVTVQQQTEGGVNYSVVQAPAGNSPMAVTYAVVDGYLMIASSLDTAKQAVRRHRSGESLAKSQKFLSALPPGHPEGMSALFYQDPLAMAALQMQRIAPGSAATAAVTQSIGSTPEPVIMTAYATDTAIRGVSTNQMMDAGAFLVGAAVAIPNLLRSRVAANEASAVGSLRTIVTAQVTYSATYPDRGFAPDLGSLSGAGGDPDHAGLIDATLGCGGGQWCEKNGYRFRLSTACLQGQCAQFVAMATPANPNTGNRTFCTTSDGVIRMRIGPPLTSPIRATECKT